MREDELERRCPDCDWKTVGTMPENLKAYADHSTVHNPSPAQWANAYELMQAAKEAKKKSEKKEEVEF